MPKGFLKLNRMRSCLGSRTESPEEGSIFALPASAIREQRKSGLWLSNRLIEDERIENRDRAPIFPREREHIAFMITAAVTELNRQLNRFHALS